MSCVPCKPPSRAIKFCKIGKLSGHKERVFDVSWSPSRGAGAPSRLASVGQTCGFVWSATADAEPPIRLAGNELLRVCWHVDGLHVLTGSAEGKVNICATSDGVSKAVLDASTTDEVYGLTPLSDGLLAVGAGNTMQLWDLNRAARAVQVEFATAENGIIFGGSNRNPEGKAYVFSLATRGRAMCAALSDGTVRLLDSQTLETAQVLDEHTRRGSAALAVAVSPTAPQLASSDGQGAVLLWDMRHLGKGPFAETSHQDAVHALAFVPGVGSSAGELLATGGGDAYLRVHETQSSALATKGSTRMLSALLCVQAAPDAASPRVAAAGGSGGLVTDAGISLWQLEDVSDEDAAIAASREAAERQEEQVAVVERGGCCESRCGEAAAGKQGSA